MSRRCGTCGETLLGAVNRCWKCGSEAPVQALPVEAPSGDSPFSEETLAAPAPQRDYDHQSLITGTAYASVVVGIFALILSWWLPHATVPAVVGLGCGAWSLSQRRNRLAVIGVLLCLFALYWSGVLMYRSIYEWYDLNYGDDFSF